MRKGLGKGLYFQLGFGVGGKQRLAPMIGNFACVYLYTGQVLIPQMRPDILIRAQNKLPALREYLTAYLRKVFCEKAGIVPRLRRQKERLCNLILLIIV